MNRVKTFFCDVKLVGSHRDALEFVSPRIVGISLLLKLRGSLGQSHLGKWNRKAVFVIHNNQQTGRLVLPGGWVLIAAGGLPLPYGSLVRRG